MSKKKKIQIPDPITVQPFENFNEVFDFLEKKIGLIDIAEQISFIKSCMDEDTWIQLCGDVKDGVDDHLENFPQDEIEDDEFED